MPDAVTFGVFATAALALLLIPGPAVLYIVTRSAEHGRTVGIASVLGIHTGTTVHVAAAALGLSALLVQSAVLFTTVKLAGGAYLIALGLKRLLRPPAATEDGAAKPGRAAVTPGEAYRQGVIVNVLNPKTALFFLAFLPQFVDPDRNVLLQTVVLGLTFIAIGMVTDGTYAMLAGTIGAAARRRTRLPSLGTRLAGLVYIGLGVTAALTRRSTPAST